MVRPRLEMSMPDTWLLSFRHERSKGESDVNGMDVPKAVAPPHHDSPANTGMSLWCCACNAVQKSPKKNRK